MTTRSKNANTHPGIMAQDALRVYHKKEDIEAEKELKNIKREATQRKKASDEAQQAAGKEYIEQLESEEATANAKMENEFPRK